MLVIKDVNLDLENTITCGQIFRFKKEDDNSFTVIMSDRVVNLKMNNNNLIVLSSSEEDLEDVIKSYLDLDRNYDKINDKILENDSSLKDVIDKCNGFKIMHTPKLETCISYIISQNNGVPQIRNSLNLLSEKYGKRVEFMNNVYYLFPNINELKKLSISDFHECKTGFRDKYLYNFINSNIKLDKIDDMATDDALKYLMNIKGIGLKVASCILLFAYQRFDVFPIDTWVKKYFSENYNLDDIKKISFFAKEKYGAYSGLVIQYIFNYSRNK